MRSPSGATKWGELLAEARLRRHAAIVVVEVVTDGDAVMKHASQRDDWLFLRRLQNGCRRCFRLRRQSPRPLGTCWAAAAAGPRRSASGSGPGSPLRQPLPLGCTEYTTRRLCVYTHAYSYEYSYMYSTGTNTFHAFQDKDPGKVCPLPRFSRYICISNTCSSVPARVE